LRAKVVKDGEGREEEGKGVVAIGGCSVREGGRSCCGCWSLSFCFLLPPSF
jgi:hypothetical protein